MAGDAEVRRCIHGLTEKRCPTCSDGSERTERHRLLQVARAHNAEQRAAFMLVQRLVRHEAFGSGARVFERNVATYFRGRGYDAHVTPCTADGGFDVRAQQAEDVVLIQCKRYSAANPVGVEVVRALAGVVASQPGTRGLVITSSRFTADARAFAKRASIQLIDGAEFARQWRNLRRGQLELGLTAMCPRCGRVVSLAERDYLAPQINCPGGHSFTNLVTMRTTVASQPTFARSRTRRRRPT